MLYQRPSQILHTHSTCLAAHAMPYRDKNLTGWVDIRMLLIHAVVAHIPLFLYPFLNTSSKTRPFEYLRLTSLGVIGALVKVNTVKWRNMCRKYPCML